MKKILIDVNVNKGMLEKLKAIEGLSVNVIDFNDKNPRYLDPETVQAVNYLFCTFPCTNLDDMKSLEYIQIDSAGYSQLCGLDLPKRKIAASNARGVFDTPIAEWCIAMMVNLARDIRGLIRNQEACMFDRQARFQSEIRGSVVGIWGYGSIGRETARLAKAMGLTVYAMDRVYPSNSETPDIYRVDGTGDPDATIPARKFAPGQEEEFLRNLDFLVMTMPLTNNTKGLVGEKELSCLKPTAYILNPARGQLIDEQALLDALREGSIAGAALDTHHYYPMPADHPFWRFPNVIMTPHISGSTQSPFFTERVWDIFVQNAERMLAGKPVLNRLSDEQLKGE